MKRPLTCLLMSLLMFAGITAKAQYSFLTEAPANERLKVLWQYCSDNLISDKDSASTHQFLEGVANVADSLGDTQLKKYATYFRMCFRLLFSFNYQQYFAEGDYESAAGVFKAGKAWALQNQYYDVAAACEHYIGEVYFNAARYGLAFDYLLKADNSFRKIGYKNVPAVSIYLSDLALNYYRFEEYDKSLTYFLSASRHPFYLARVELNSLNSIGLIYARKKEWDKAVSFYRKTIEKAEAYENPAWVGIASGNLGNIFLTNGQNDSALLYHSKNYYLNIVKRSGGAPEDAAKSALAMATVFVRQQQPDSALYYIHLGQELAREYIWDPAERLEFRRRVLVVMMEITKGKGDYKKTMLFSDTLSTVKDSLQQMLDAKILNRAVEKSEAERYGAELKLLESQKSLSRLRFYMLIAVVLCLMITAALLFNRYRNRKQRESKLSEKEREILALEKIRAEEQLKHAQELLTAYLTTIKEKTSLIENMDVEMQRLKETASQAFDLQGIAANREKLISTTILTQNDWQHFRNLFEQVHPGFLDRLRERFSDLSPAEIRLLMLTKLALSSYEMANMLGISIESVRKSRYRLRKKLNLEEESNLESLILQI